MRVLLFIAICICNYISAIAIEKSPLTFKIIDTESAQPISYCCARFLNHDIGTLANENGLVSFKYQPSLTTDTIEFYAIGYESFLLPPFSPKDTLYIELSKKPYQLNEITVSPPQKTKKIKKGKKRSFGLFSQSYQERKGSTYGFDIESSDKRTWLESISFYCKTAPNMLSSMKFRVNIYDASLVSGKETENFVSVQNNPIYIDYSKEMITDDKFIYKFDEPILLPQKAMVEIEFLEDMNGEYIIVRGGLVGGWIWTGSPSKKEWIKLPFSSPFFIECIQEK